MVDVKKPLEARRLLLDFLILKHVKESKEGISGYELHKHINQTLSSKANSSSFVINTILSQSQIYRILDDLKANGFVNVVENVILNKRLQNLFHINETGEEYQLYLSNIIKELFPSTIVIDTLIEDLLTGKQSPFDIILESLPSAEHLPQLRIFRNFVASELSRIDQRIRDLEKNGKSP